MKYRGYLLKESLLDTRILDKLTITETETMPCTKHMQADYMDDVWTRMVFVGKSCDADNISEQLSKVIKPKGWYLDIHTDKDNYLIFHGKVVKYPRIGEKQPWPEEAIELARKAEIPAFVNKETVCTEEV